MLMRVEKKMVCRRCSGLVVVIWFDSCSNAPAGRGVSDGPLGIMMTRKCRWSCHVCATGWQLARWKLETRDKDWTKQALSTLDGTRASLVYFGWNSVLVSVAAKIN